MEAFRTICGTGQMELLFMKKDVPWSELSDTMIRGSEEKRYEVCGDDYYLCLSSGGRRDIFS